MLAPANTPATIINRLNREVVGLLNQADQKERFFKVGVETVGGSPEQLAATIRAEMDSLGKLVKNIGLRVD
jgi:tripartite-type tricarboxylate transporter receptor subunit TctC